MEYIITFAGESDIDRVATIETASFSVPWSTAGFFDVLPREDVIFLVAQNTCPKKSEVLGYMCMYLSLDEAELTNIAVEQTARGCGIGMSLLKRGIEEAKSLGIKRIVLEARVSNEPALRMYDKAGFRLIGTRKNFYTKPTEDACILEYEIC